MRGDTVLKPKQWTLYLCQQCGWGTAGVSFDIVPDTDCPSCRSHDAVLDTEIPVFEPCQPDLVIERNRKGLAGNVGN